MNTEFAKCTYITNYNGYYSRLIACYYLHIGFNIKYSLERSNDYVILD